jgi:S-adenosyl methyltransferase
VAHSARIYDYILGGKDNFEADRMAAETAIARNPNMAAGMRANRAVMSMTKPGTHQVNDDWRPPTSLSNPEGPSGTGCAALACGGRWPKVSLDRFCLAVPSIVSVNPSG